MYDCISALQAKIITENNPYKKGCRTFTLRFLIPFSDENDFFAQCSKYEVQHSADIKTCGITAHIKNENAKMPPISKSATKTEPYEKPFTKT